MESLCLFQLINSEFLGNGLYSSISDLVVVNKPVEALGCGCHIIGHNFAEAFVVGDNEEVDHDDIAELQPVDEIGHAHFAEGIEHDDGGAWVGIDEVLDLLQEDLCVFDLRHWKEDQLDGLGSVIGLQSAIEIVDSEHLHLFSFEVLERNELPEKRFEHFDKLV